MQLAHRVALNGVQLDEVDPRIIIKGIEEGAGKETTGAVSLGGRDGTRITGKRRDTVEVQVRFGLNIRTKQLQERSDIFEAVNAWAAKGGYLTVNYKNERRLYCDEVVLPGAGDQYKRTNEYTITFRAHAVPYWQQDPPASASTGTGTSATGVIQAAGSARTVCDAELQNMSGANIASATITVNGYSMAFSDLGLGNGETLKISHNDKGVLAIKIGNRSVMAKRTEGSADELWADPGNNGFSFSAQRACKLTISCRGRFA